LSKMKRRDLSGSSYRAAMLATVLTLWAMPAALAQDQAPPPQGVSRGENFSAKPPAQLFASDCTGSGCHKGPQGLGKNVGIGGLAGFLREHYTNSRESAAALANYLSKIPAPEPKEVRTPRGGKPATAAAPASSGPGGWFETPSASPPKPAPNEARKPPAGQNAATHTPPSRPSRASVKPDDDPAAAPTSAAHHPAAEPAESAPKPDEPAAKSEDAAAKPAESSAEPAAKPAATSKPSSPARAQRGRQPAATAAAPMVTPVAPEAVPTPPAPPPAPKEYDIFD
jgi:hypothetical protein